MDNSMHSKLSILVPAFGLLVALAPGSSDAQEADFPPPLVFQAAGPNAAAIQGSVDAYRAALGDPNGSEPGPLPGGRREINWDGGGSDATTDPVTPFEVFLDSRGAQFT